MFNTSIYYGCAANGDMKVESFTFYTQKKTKKQYTKYARTISVVVRLLLYSSTCTMKVGVLQLSSSVHFCKTLNRGDGSQGSSGLCELYFSSQLHTRLLHSPLSSSRTSSRATSPRHPIDAGWRGNDTLLPAEGPPM